MPVAALQIEIHRVGQRILLSVDPALGDGLFQVFDVDRDRLEAERAEDLLMQCAVERAMRKPVQSCGARIGRARLVMWRNPLSQKPSTR